MLQLVAIIVLAGLGIHFSDILIIVRNLTHICFFQLKRVAIGLGFYVPRRRYDRCRNHGLVCKCSFFTFLIPTHTSV